MQLTRYSDYAVRVLLYLALAPERLVTIDEVAAGYGISRAHLTKVAHELGRRGYLEAVRGRSGGLRLGRPAEAIRLGALIRETEPSLALVECFRADGACAIEPACGLRPVLDEALAAFLAVLDRYTLADLVVRRRTPLARLLETAAATRGGRGPARPRPASARRRARSRRSGPGDPTS